MTQHEPDNLDTPIHIHAEENARPASPVAEKPPGFLPIETNWFDRLFIGVMLWVALSLFWFRVMEPLGLSIWISNAIALVVGIILVRKG